MRRILTTAASFVVFIIVSGCSSNSNVEEVPSLEELKQNYESVAPVKVRVFWRGFSNIDGKKPINREFRVADRTNFEELLNTIIREELARERLHSIDEIDWQRVRLSSPEVLANYRTAVEKIKPSLMSFVDPDILPIERQRREFMQLANGFSTYKTAPTYEYGWSRDSDVEGHVLSSAVPLYVLVLPHKTAPKQETFEIHKSVSDQQHDWFATAKGQVVKTYEGSFKPINCYHAPSFSEGVRLGLEPTLCDGIELTHNSFLKFDGLSVEGYTEKIERINQQILHILANSEFFIE